MTKKSGTRRLITLGVLVVLLAGLAGGTYLVFSRGKAQTGLLARADMLVADGEYEAAEPLLHDLIKSSPDQPAPYTRLFHVYVRTSRYAEAEALATQWLELGFDADVGRNLLVDSLLRQMKVAEAERVANRAAWADPRLALRTRQIVHEALGTPWNRMMAQAAATRLAGITSDPLVRMQLLWFAAFTLKDVLETESSEPPTQIAERLEPLVAAAHSALASTAAFQASSVYAKGWQARLKLLSPERWIQDEGADFLGEDAVEDDRGKVALAAHYCSRRQAADALKWTEAVQQSDSPLRVKLQAVRRLAAYGWLAEARGLLSAREDRDSPQIRWVESQILLKGSDAEMREAAAIVRGLIDESLTDVRITRWTAAALDRRDLTDEAVALLEAFLKKSDDPSPQLRIDLARMLGRSSATQARALELVSTTAAEIPTVKGALALLGSLRASPEDVERRAVELGGDDEDRVADERRKIRRREDELIGRYLETLIDQGGPAIENYRLIHAVFLVESLKALESPDQPPVLKKVEEELRAATLEGASKAQLNFAARVAVRASRAHTLCGELFGRMLQMPGAPDDTAMSALRVARTLRREASASSAFLAGLRTSLPAQGVDFAEILADLAAEEEIKGTDELLVRLERVTEVDSLRVPTLQLMLFLAAADDDYERVKTGIDALLAAAPTSRMGLGLRGQVLIAEKNYEGLIASHAGIDNVQNSILLCQQLAESLWRLEKFEQAVEVASRCVEANSGSEAAYVLLARAHLAEGREDLALGVLSVAPEGVRSRLMRASLLDRRGESDVAERMLRDLAEGGNSDSAWQLLAGILEREGRGHEFVQIVSEQIEQLMSLSVDRRPSPGMFSHLYFLRGLTQAGRHEIKSAVADYEHAAALNSRNLPALNNAAWLIYLHYPARLDEAVAYVDQALALSPNNVNVLDSAAMIYNKIGKSARALELVELALAAGENPAYLCDRAEILRALDRKDDATEAAANVLERYPGTEAASRAESLLQRWRAEDRR